MHSKAFGTPVWKSMLDQVPACLGEPVWICASKLFSVLHHLTMGLHREFDSKYGYLAFLALALWVLVLVPLAEEVTG